MTGISTTEGIIVQILEAISSIPEEKREKILRAFLNVVEVMIADFEKKRRE